MLERKREGTKRAAALETNETLQIKRRHSMAKEKNNSTQQRQKRRKTRWTKKGNQNPDLRTGDSHGIYPSSPQTGTWQKGGFTNAWRTFSLDTLITGSGLSNSKHETLPFGIAPSVFLPVRNQWVRQDKLKKKRTTEFTGDSHTAKAEIRLFKRNSETSVISLTIFEAAATISLQADVFG